MKNEKDNQADEAMQAKYEAMLLLKFQTFPPFILTPPSENLINKNQGLLKENQELIVLLTHFLLLTFEIKH